MLAVLLLPLAFAAKPSDNQELTLKLYQQYGPVVVEGGTPKKEK